MGHATGDRVLKAVGERLRASVRETATVARLGGDEFTVVLEDVQHIDDAQKVAGELLEVFTSPLALDGGQHVVISPSIGISLYPDHAQVPTDLLKYADTAMYQAKEEGRNVFRVYTRDQVENGADSLDPLGKAVRYGFYGPRSGDVFIVPDPQLRLDEVEDVQNEVANLLQTAAHH